MKSTKKIMNLVATLCLLFVASLRLSAQKSPAAKTIAPGFAVLELFTSEGCSSCPPAEALLEQIDRSSVGKPVYVLAYHVDYWDRQGWKDAFSDHRFSTRQYQYSRNFSAQVYTPQLVINGTSEGIGSDEQFVSRGIRQALSAKAEATLAVHLKKAGDTGVLHYQIQGNTQNAKLVVAVVQKHAISHVLRGENEGRTLSHAAIVRDLQTFTIDKDKTGDVTVRLPRQFNQTDWDAVSFLQDPQTGRIWAASRADII